MASIGTQASLTSYFPPQWIYDVFISFRGEDTRNNFTSHLYTNLAHRGIDVYMDDRDLVRGKTIEVSLWKAIEESRFSVIVFSRYYASSPWCLDELAKIVQCMKEMGHTVLPIFYDVDPSEVAEQKGNYEKAFIDHEENFSENLEKVQSWKDCLTTVANLSGWDLRSRKHELFDGASFGRDWDCRTIFINSSFGWVRIAVNPTDKVLPSLSGLCSLEVLDLCACNLGEGAVPEDIGCLSSLRCLDLSRNNFVSLPKSLNQLSRLEILALEDCRMLESLAEVPSKVQTVNLNGCRRLKKVPDPIKLSSLKRSEFNCLNCWELYKHNGQDSMGLTMLKRYLQGSSNPRPGFGIVVPGHEILGWFNHQSEGSSISVEVLSKYLDCDGSGPMGFAACVAFSAYNESSSLFCHFKANGRENYPSLMCISCNSIQVLSDHLWLFYLSFDYLKELKEWQHESFSNIELSFHSYDRVKVKNCGVSLLYSPSSESSAANSSGSRLWKR
ncbi:unnamed protein product [Dovyalis caffra]|uniref:ADP-ribosyl cyclase/cyclic ADP-ribose hydrolase n=1 Tax=Dovyalis caffra TaxID=77055 RepID=A0AAV1S241_9ROSI|nr:unnamed protein product [Dovyalis caffra]